MTVSFQKQSIKFEDFAAIAFTSANGVRALGPAGEKARALPVFAVGEMTAAAAREAGFTDVTAAGGDVESLTATIAAATGRFDGAVLHPAGADRAGDLAGGLARRGIVARTVLAYKAAPEPRLSPEAEAAIAGEPPPEWVVFFSPRSARLFLDQAASAGLRGRLVFVRAACLSDAVAEAAGEGWAEIRIAARRDAAAMIELMQR